MEFCYRRIKIFIEEYGKCTYSQRKLQSFRVSNQKMIILAERLHMQIASVHLPMVVHF